MPSLFEPLDLGAVRTANRVFMAPLTRMRASQPGNLPNDLMRVYYAQRAGAGLVISEGTQISAEGMGYSDTPGIHSPEQLAGWKRVTDAVHAEGGLIAAQLWHTGRVNHESLHDGGLPVSASAIEFRGRTSLKDAEGRIFRADCPTPRALETEELPRVVEDYRRAARNAIDAGFDLVEVHAAHGYLLHQFLAEPSNQRTDGYGGSVENRARLLLEVIDAIVDEIGNGRVGVRVSPQGSFNGLDAADGGASVLYAAGELASRDLAFLHLSEPDWTGAPPLDEVFRKELRAAYDGVIVGAGGYDLAKAEQMLGAGYVDAVAFGRAFIANPDLPVRLAEGIELSEVVQETVYGGGAEGYTDYPAAQVQA
ncbi:N-ethylmaleimide reductase [Nocardioides daedukensis]|uniref:N-ethylmaleimide reductase n=1 Tax=Nocardioides daedukensis TaxID=634462 RepID=A0A7Y9UQP7_9ACTN|nr:N-ethylmaleimide reductase [Nocardioides daedukensis]NYG58826.1 N-ethylmaleimide reductase [Nocardioides daedukensis]